MAETITPTSILELEVGHRLASAMTNKSGALFQMARDQDGVMAIRLEPTGPAKPFYDEYRAPASLRMHRLHSLESLVAYAKRYGSPGGSIIFCDYERAVFIPDDQLARGSREMVWYEYPASRQWQAWDEMLSGEGHSHKGLLAFLRRQEADLLDPSLLVALASVRMTAVVEANSDLREDGAALGFVVRTQAGEQLVKCPRSFGISIPVLEGDMGFCDFKIRLVIDMPTAERQLPSFTLLCGEWIDVRRKRNADLCDEIAEKLGADWLVVAGQPSYWAPQPRNLDTTVQLPLLMPDQI